MLIPNVQREIDNENNEEDDAISVEQLDSEFKQNMGLYQRVYLTLFVKTDNYRKASIKIY